MRTLKIFALAILGIAVIDCNEDEDITPNDCDTLVGNPWNLTLFSGGWLGLYEFQEGDVVWEFYDGDSLVMSVNDSIAMIPEFWPYLPEGTFNYSVINEDSLILYNQIIGLGNKYAYSLTEGELILSQSPEVDGLEYTFGCE